MYAISTVWNSWRARSGEEIAREAAGLGFSHLELNFSLPSRLFCELAELRREGKADIVSLHNFCPLPLSARSGDTMPDMFLLSSPSEAEREKAVRFTKQTIASARDIGAKCVVLHLGRVDIRFDGSRTLMALVESGKEGTGYYKFLKGRFLLKRERNRKRYLEQIYKSVGELNEFAVTNSIKLGIETRYYIREIPSFEEVGLILDRFKGGNVYYWHDVGHAQLKENLGIDSHEEYLKRYSDRMVGMHIHDIVKTDDHRAPLAGGFDFKKLKPYLKKETIKVFEPHTPATAEEIARGLKYFREEICPE